MSVKSYAFPFVAASLLALFSACRLVSPGTTISAEAISEGREFAEQVSQSRIEGYLEHFNSPRCMYLSPDGVLQARTYIIQELRNIGYTEEAIIEDMVTISGMTISDGGGPNSGVSIDGAFSMPNIIVKKAGRDPSLKPVLIGAHYDTVANAPGANDNGSGCAALLEMARVLAASALPRTIVMVFFAFEEPGVFGSRQYVSGLAPAEFPVAAYILDTIGVTATREKTLPIVRLPESGDFIAIMSSSSTAAKKAIADFLSVTGSLEIDLPAFGLNADGNASSSFLTSNVMRSDHVPFLAKGIPALFITDTADFREGLDYYHRTTDIIQNIDFIFLQKVASATLANAVVAALSD